MTHTEPTPSTAQYKLASLDIYVVEVLAQEETLVHAVQVGRGQVRRALGLRSRRARAGLLCMARLHQLPGRATTTDCTN